jgi:outer membrane protein OmpA-like peptidoglycan-associated protein
VYGVAVGAFEFYAGADAEVGGAAGVAGFGGEARSKAAREVLTRNGDASTCAKATRGDAAPPDGCGALIRVDVVPLGEEKAHAPVCPEGTDWNGSQCIGRKVVTQVDCPGGTKWDGARCVANVDTSCAAGMHFVAGKGCIGDAPAAPPAPAPSAVAGPSPQDAGPSTLIAVTPTEIRLRQQIHFQFDKDAILPSSFALLDAIVAALRENPTVTLEVQGHTDNRGAAQYNLKLSQKRAESVVAYLVGKGIDKSRLTAKGYGMERPLVPNSSEEERAKNRRIELVRTDRQ